MLLLLLPRAWKASTAVLAAASVLVEPPIKLLKCRILAIFLGSFLTLCASVAMKHTPTVINRMYHSPETGTHEQQGTKQQLH